ncbi:PrgH/EprH family type III secretion inner membrane ring protein [Salmonella enterica subsp. salamae]|nr:PrgH/EprH family type III secretion inner membrane ring protein [Salmonella enterica subsp. salamae]ECJ2281840.1 PrgH/EprH family type III secretion inner membrane ring protein [Salmonella enterica subsp. salamae]
METSKEKTITSPGPYLVRLLNSSLNGCEFPLLTGRTLFVVGQSDVLTASGQLPDLPADSFFIPLEQGGINFEIQLDADASEIILHELREGNTHSRPVELNTPIQVGELLILVRPECEPWAPTQSEKSDVAIKKKEPRYKNGIVTALACFVILGIGTVGTIWILNSPQRQAAELDSLLGQEKERFQVLPGRDKILYVSAQNERDTLWARQVLARGDYDKNARVINENEENKRISLWLDIYYPQLAYYRLHFDDPRKPVFWLSRQRNDMSKKEIAVLRKKLTSLMPYADSINITLMNDATAAGQAEAGLKQLALPYSRKNHKGGVTFIIQGALDDVEILRARQFVDSYYQTWGGRYVQFAIELKDDWLKGRSFQYGAEGYIKMSPGHWYFPSPL